MVQLAEVSACWAVPDARRALAVVTRQRRSAQILTADSVQQQPIAAPGGSEIDHKSLKYTEKRIRIVTVQSPFWHQLCEKGTDDRWASH